MHSMAYKKKKKKKKPTSGCERCLLLKAKRRKRKWSWNTSTFMTPWQGLLRIKRNPLQEIYSPEAIARMDFSPVPAHGEKLPWRPWRKHLWSTNESWLSKNTYHAAAEPLTMPLLLLIKQSEVSLLKVQDYLLAQFLSHAL